MLSTIKNEWRHYLPYALLLLIILIFGYRFLFTPTASPIFEIPEEEIEEIDTVVIEQPSSIETNVVFVDVKGAVQRPGVYELQENDRVQQAIALAGGLTSDAASGAINLALKVQDEMVVHVPTVDEFQPDDQQWEELVQTPTSLAADLIDINTATVEQFVTLPGIGPKKAEAIVRHREEVGKFQSIEELVNVPGIGAKTVENIAAHLFVK